MQVTVVLRVFTTFEIRLVLYFSNSETGALTYVASPPPVLQVCFYLYSTQGARHGCQLDA